MSTDKHTTPVICIYTIYYNEAEGAFQKAFGFLQHCQKCNISLKKDKRYVNGSHSRIGEVKSTKHRGLGDLKQGFFNLVYIIPYNIKIMLNTR